MFGVGHRPKLVDVYAIPHLIARCNWVEEILSGLVCEQCTFPARLHKLLNKLVCLREPEVTYDASFHARHTRMPSLVCVFWGCIYHPCGQYNFVDSENNSFILYYQFLEYSFKVFQAWHVLILFPDSYG